MRARSFVEDMPASSKSYFFIVGCPRSGTTLLSVLLDRHSRICVPPETAFFDEIAPWVSGAALEPLIQRLRQWRRLEELQIEAGALLQRLTQQRLSPGTVLSAILDAYSESRNKRHCGEKTPQHLFHVPTIIQTFPDAKILCMLRDGREVALSLGAMPWGPPKLAAAARMWKKSVHEMERFTKDYPSQFRVVRYEDLVARPTETLSATVSFLGEAFEPQQMDPAKPSHVVLARSMDWKRAALQAIEPERIGWRRAEAPADQIAFLERKLAKELARSGYRSP